MYDVNNENDYELILQLRMTFFIELLRKYNLHKHTTTIFIFNE